MSPMKKVGTVAEYLRAVPPKPRAALQALRRTIKAAAPGAVEVIGYGMPGFKLEGRTLVYYAAFKDHCSFFPASGRVIAAHKADLKGRHTSKGTIRFTAEKPLPATLIRKMVKARVKEIEALS
jgi:uncharacterized protein YdhG (YjbR/CyaY superfamily)